MLIGNVSIIFCSLEYFFKYSNGSEYNNYGDSYSKYPTDDKKYNVEQDPLKAFS